jgi:glycosyltransferase involved in cell wall biosynthesis
MHVLIIPSWYPTDITPLGGIFFQEQAQGLKKAGHQVGVIFPERKSLKWFRFKNLKSYISYENDQGVATVRKKGWRWFPRIPYAYANLYLNDGLVLYKEYVREYGEPDVIHAHAMHFGGVLAARIKKKYDIPFVVTEHSSAFAMHQIKPWQKNYLPEIYQNVSKIITVSPELGKILVEEYDCQREIIEIVPNIVSVEFLTINNYKAQVNNKFIFLTVSFLSYIKGHHILLDAFAKKYKNNNQYELWIGGDGEERANIEKQANDLGISGQVKFLGMLSRAQVRDYMQQTDVFVLPSLYETFGVVVIEALACGKPVVATRCGGPEYIINELNGILVTSNDVEAFADAMEKMVECFESYDRVLIRQDCVDRFSGEAVTKQLGRIYQEVLYTKGVSGKLKRSFVG